MENAARTRPTIHGVSHALIGEGARLVGTAALFIATARALGVVGYGEFLGAFALVSAVAGFSNFGAAHVMIRSVAAHGVPAITAAQRAISTTAVGGVCGVVIAALIGVLALPAVPVTLLVCLAVSENLINAVIEVVCNVGVATRDLRTSAGIRGATSVLRVLVLLALVASAGRVTATTWAVWYLLTSLAMIPISARIGLKTWLPRFSHPGGLRTVIGGLPFSLNLGAAYIQDDIDKTMVLHYEGDFVAGYYSAGYRVVNFAMVPIRAAINATYAGFFEAGGGGFSAALRFAHRNLRWLAPYGAVAGIGCWLFAGVVPSVLGAEYDSAADVIRMLALLPLLRCFEYMYADALTGAGAQTTRTFIIGATCVANVIMNVLLIPTMSWRGAAVATIVTESAAVIFLFLAIGRRARRESRESVRPGVGTES